MTHTSFPKKKKKFIKLIGRNLIKKVNIYDPKRPDTFGHTNAVTYMAALQCHYTSVKARNQIPGTARLDVQNSKNNQIHIH